MIASVIMTSTPFDLIFDPPKNTLNHKYIRASCRFWRITSYTKITLSIPMQISTIAHQRRFVYPFPHQTENNLLFLFNNIPNGVKWRFLKLILLNRGCSLRLTPEKSLFLKKFNVVVSSLL